jgi:hypothetical protein
VIKVAPWAAEDHGTPCAEGLGPQAPGSRLLPNAGSLDAVPARTHNKRLSSWRPRQDSNLRPSD